MSKRDPRVALRQMLDHAQEAVAVCSGRQRSDLDAYRLFNLAITRLVEVVGEAACRVSDEVRQGHPEIPWSSIVSTRNRLIHGYDEVNLDILWNIVVDDLPPLIAALSRALGSSD